MTQKTSPTVVLLGRTNVGKSTIFNRMTKNIKSLVFDRSGVTRDYKSELIEWDKKKFTIIDAGGLPLGKNLDQIDTTVKKQLIELIQDADVILFVCDGQSGPTLEDQIVAQIARHTTKPVFVVANKMDNLLRLEDAAEFGQFGFEKIFSVSAIHGHGISDLLTHVAELMPDKSTAKLERPTYKVSIIGKPNVGKSSLLNLLLRKDRAIVADLAGTTREAIAESIKLHHNLVELTDTAGIRRSRSVNDSLEELMVKSSMQAVRESDMIVVMVDGSTLEISDQELKLLFYAYEEYKAVVLFINKCDLSTEDQKASFLHDLSSYEHMTKKIPVIWGSCLEEKNIAKVKEVINEVWEACQQKFNSTEVNDYIQENLEGKGMYHNGQQIKIFKVRHIKASIPSFVIHTNHPEWLRPCHKAFVENLLRKRYNLSGCPIKFLPRRA